MSASPAKRPVDQKTNNDGAKPPKRAKKGDIKPGDTKVDQKKEKQISPEVALQQSLLRSDNQLRFRFLEALHSKPDSISLGKFGKQFWSARSHLLRAHAIEKEQKRASYNVLSEVKPRNVEGSIKLNIKPEQVQDIFRQHPVVRKAYDDNVPNNYPDTMGFFSKFFTSRLFKKLKGERITDADEPNPYLDKYLNRDQEVAQGQAAAEAHVPHFIDLEGNENNHTQRKGNRPDISMRPQASDKVPLLRILNQMSEKIMSQVEPADGDLHQPVGIDEETFNQLRLNDLQASEVDNRVRLDIQDQTHVGGEDSSHLSREARAHAKLDPKRTLSHLRHALRTANVKSNKAAPGMDLAAATGFNDTDSSPENSDLDSDDNGANDRNPKPTSRHTDLTNSLKRATSHLRNLITTVSTRAFDPSHTANANTSPNDPSLTYLSEKNHKDLILTHHTTNEFLSYFWALLLPLMSDSPSAPSPSKQEMPALLTTLEKSLARLDAVAAAAETERQTRLKELRTKAAETSTRLRRKVGVNEAEAGPGRKEVEWLVEPTVKAIAVAKARFRDVSA